MSCVKTKVKIKKTCYNCMKGTRISVTNDVICREKGIVSYDFYCPNHMIMPEDDLNRRMLDYKCSDCINFEFFNHPEIPTYGVCSLFSVRKCDGSEKKTCSKFEKRHESRRRKLPVSAYNSDRLSVLLTPRTEN